MGGVHDDSDVKITRKFEIGIDNKKLRYETESKIE